MPRLKNTIPLGFGGSSARHYRGSAGSEHVFSKLSGSHQSRCTPLSKIGGVGACFLEAFGLSPEPIQTPIEDRWGRNTFSRSFWVLTRATTHPYRGSGLPGVKNMSFFGVQRGQCATSTHFGNPRGRNASLFRLQRDLRRDVNGDQPPWG